MADHSKSDDQQREPPRGGLTGLPPRGGLGPLPPRNTQPAPATPAAPSAPTPAPAAAATPSSGAPAGLGGLGLAPRRPAAPAGLGGSSPLTPQHASAPAPSERPAEATPTAAAPASSAAPSLPARGLPSLPPRGGLGPLPARPGASTAAATPAATHTTSTPAAQPAAPVATPTVSQPVAPAATPTPAAVPTSTPSLPTRPAAVPSLPARPAGAVPGRGLGPGGLGRGLGGAIPGRGLAPGGRGPPGGRGVGPAAPAAAAIALAADQVVDPTEEPAVQRLQAQVQGLRVALLRAAARLGLRYDSPEVGQFLQVVSRVELLQGGYKGQRRADLPRLAEREARDREEREHADSRLPIHIKVMVVGMVGVGKSALINALLDRPATRTNAYKQATKRVQVVRGNVHGIRLDFIDTPGLYAAASVRAQNQGVMRALKSAYKKHSPHFVLYVDRADAVKAGLGDLPILTQLVQALGMPATKSMMMVLTHAHAARDAMGIQFDNFLRQRQQILAQLLRQAITTAAGGGGMGQQQQQAPTPLHLVDSHPACPTNNLGQSVVLISGQQVAWKQKMLFMLLGYRVYEQVQELFRERVKSQQAASAAGAKSAAQRQQDMLAQLFGRRARLPNAAFVLEQMCEGVMSAPGWGNLEADEGSENMSCEEFDHMYYDGMYRMALQGDGLALKEYWRMMKRVRNVRKKWANMYNEEDDENFEDDLFQGMLNPGMEVDTTFDPDNVFESRFIFPLESHMPLDIMPSMDYYGFEHEHVISGIVAEWSGQPFNRRGWGGIPMELSMALEKDKTTTCVQADWQATVVHNIQPFGKRHLSHLRSSVEMLRPNLSEVLWQFEANTFRDGLLLRNDHAGVGGVVMRMSKNGSPFNGPTAYGMRVQDTFRAGPFKVEACAARVNSESAQGGRQEVWGGRAFVKYDYLPALSMAFDWSEEKTSGPSSIDWGAVFDWDCVLAKGIELDFDADVIPGQCVHLNMELSEEGGWRSAWLLMIPAVNLLKGWWRNWKNRGMEEEEMLEGGEGGEEGGDELDEEQLAALEKAGLLANRMGGGAMGFA